MKLLLSAFGLGTAEPGYFNRMPAVTVSRFGSRFVPDYPVVLLFDQFVVDATARQLLKKNPAFAEMNELLDALNAAGRLEERDFDSEISQYREAIDSAVAYDLQQIQRWRDAFQESFERWERFVASAREYLYLKKELEPLTTEEELLELELTRSGHISLRTAKYSPIESLLERWKERLDAEEREQVRSVTTAYLTYVTAHLVLSDIFGAVVHDWTDFEPLYRRKLEIGARARELTASEDVTQVRQLFRVLSPDFEPKNARAVVKAIEDRRIDELRRLVRDAAEGKTTFDTAFAIATFREVLQIDKRTEFRRNIVGWAGLALDLIPLPGMSVAQKAVETIAGSAIDAQAQRSKSWFYLISDMGRFTRAP